ncbi:type IV secretion system protein [Dyella sp.]|uniref:type IV secretion system protein n=1 Tax=Dyella sp. TaxID=1869338 RepID=UPI002B497EE9|nr:type IV secretion system protein [Dyella sp.]HKT28397.1 type IV secretion system protein [Dyella sp.]
MIDTFTDDLMGRAMDWVGIMAYALVTLWVMFTGYRAITGTLREPLMAVVVNMAKVVLIVTTACSMSLFGTQLSQLIGSDLGKGVNQLISGKDTSIPAAIDKNLALTTVVMGTVNAVQMGKGAAADPLTTANQEKAQNYAVFGVAAPPISAAVMLLMYRFAMALVIGLAPIFILCLMYEPTKSLFHGWLMSCLSTLFSMAMLNVVSAMMLDISIRVATGVWAADLLGGFLPNAMKQGLMQISMEQGGIGLILTMLIITVPPMAGGFFQRTVGNFMHYSAFGNNGKGGGGMPANGGASQQDTNNNPRLKP